MTQKPLELAWTQYQTTGARAAFLDALRATYRVKKIAPMAEAYIFAPETVKGIYYVPRFEHSHYDAPFSYQSLWHKHGDTIVPGFWVGGDGLGVDFLLLIESGKVISLHHDASLFEVADDIHAKTPAAFLKQMARAGSAVTIEQLLTIQHESAAIAAQHKPDSEALAIAWVRMLARALRIPLSRLPRLLDTIPFEFLSWNSRDFVDNGGIKALIAAEKKIARLSNTTRKKADLSRCFLDTVPQTLAAYTQLTNLNLSQNQLQIQAELQQHTLTHLNLRGCQLTALPPLPPTLKHLDLSDNLISDIKPLLALTTLQTLNICDTAIAKSDILRLQVALPEVAIDTDRVLVDLSAETLSFARQNLKKLPEELATMPNLIEINLDDNPKMNWEQAFSVLSQIPTLKVISLNQKKPFVFPENCHTLTVEKIRHLDGYLPDDKLHLQFQRLATIRSLRDYPNPPFKKSEQLDIFFEYLPRFSHCTEFSLSANLLHINNERWENLFEILSAFPNLHTFKGYKLRERFQHLEKLRSLKTLILGASYLDIEELSEQIAALIQLESLTLKSVVRLSPLIGRLQNLRTLRFSVDDFRYKKRPESALSPLETLSIEYNAKKGQEREKPLFIMSDAIADLNKLETIAIAGRINTLPDAIGRIPNLKTVDLTDLKSCSPERPALPESWCQLDKLEKLIIPDLQLRKLPEQIGRLASLRELDLRNTYLEMLPDSFGQLSQLEKLTMPLTRLQQLPADCAGLTSLHTLHLEIEHDYQNPDATFTHFKQFFQALSNLKHVTLLYKGYTPKTLIELLSQLALVPTLTHLNLRTTSHKASSPQHQRLIGQLKGLQSLLLDLAQDAYAKDREQIDSALTGLSLKSLKIPLHGRTESAINQDIARLAQISTLRSLKLSFVILPKLADGPSALSQLTQLDELHLRTSSIPVVPKVLAPLSNLKILGRMRLKGGLTNEDHLQLLDMLPNCRLVDSH